MTDTKAKRRAYGQRALSAWHALPRYRPGSRGRFAIETVTIAPGEHIPLIGVREGFLTGRQPLGTTFDEPFTYAKLTDEDNGTWMTTTLQETAQMADAARQLRGRVLVGGLGLGVIPWLLAHSMRVKNVTVIEIEKDLIELIRPYVPPFGVKVVHADLFEYVKTMGPGQFDTAFYDIWQGTGEWTWQTQVVPLRRASAGKVKKILCWQETEMISQMNMMLFRTADVDAAELADRASTAHYWVWRKAVEHLRPRPRLTNQSDPRAFAEVMGDNAADADIRAMAHLYLTKVGWPAWEKRFGKYWDRTVPWYRPKRAADADAADAVD
jgi:hypothetical protein